MSYIIRLTGYLREVLPKIIDFVMRLLAQANQPSNQTVFMQEVLKEVAESYLRWRPNSQTLF